MNVTSTDTESESLREEEVDKENDKPLVVENCPQDAEASACYAAVKVSRDCGASMTTTQDIFRHNDGNSAERAREKKSHVSQTFS